MYVIVNVDHVLYILKLFTLQLFLDKAHTSVYHVYNIDYIDIFGYIIQRGSADTHSGTLVALCLWCSLQTWHNIASLSMLFVKHHSQI